ncbi:MAG: methyltransferase [Deltaproteobacteria bacterium]|nr:methyltransferase [Deltaproteobacteria bacterium]
MAEPSFPAGPPPELVTEDRLGRHVFFQPRQGYRFSIDSVLLASFATPPGPASRGVVVDLGAGAGVLPVLLAARGLAGPFLAVEIDPLAAACCRANFAAAGLTGRVLEGDLAQERPELPAGGAALVITNPPFGRPGHGRLPPEPSRARARHELALDASALWARAARLLPRGGRLALAWPATRLAEALTGLTAAGLTPKRLRCVHGRATLPAKTVLLEAAKQGRPGLAVEPPLVVYAGGQEHTPEVQAIYRELCG